MPQGLKALNVIAWADARSAQPQVNQPHKYPKPCKGVIVDSDPSLPVPSKRQTPASAPPLAFETAIRDLAHSCLRLLPFRIRELLTL
jgi:hypothetical protein